MTKLTVPSALYDTACAIAQALDTDSGGAASWGPPDPEATSYRTEGTFGRDPAWLAELLAAPSALHEFLVTEYATRWSDLAVPSLADCEAFCAGVSVSG